MAIKHIDSLSPPLTVKIARFLLLSNIFAIIPVSLWFGSFGIASLLYGNYPSIAYNPYRSGFLFSNYFRHPDEAFIAIFTPLLILNIIWFVVWVIKARKNISAFTSYFREMEFSAPSESNIVRSKLGTHYFALDTKKGTMISIAHTGTSFTSFIYPKDIRVMGFGMYDWKSVEIEGNTLRIYTGNPDFPYISLVSNKSAMLYEKIHTMRNQSWNYENNVPGYVEHQAEKIAERNGINLVLPPK